MQDLKLKQYKINNTNIKFLRDNGFRCLSGHSDFYVYDFPIYSWDHKPVLFGKIVVNTENGLVDFEVSDENGTAYAPWYDDTYSHPNRIVNICNLNFQKKMTQLGIKEVKKKKRESKYRKL